MQTNQASFEHLKLQQRLDDIGAFRAQHERFCQVVASVLADEDSEALADVEAAYARFLAIDVLDTSTEVSGMMIMAMEISRLPLPYPNMDTNKQQGKQNWNMAREGYEQRMDKLEDRVIRILCDRLRCSS